MITDVVSPWGQWSLFRNILGSQGRFWSATAAALWSCGIRLPVVPSNFSWASRLVHLNAWCLFIYSFNLWWHNKYGFQIALSFRFFSSQFVLCVCASVQQLESLVWERSGNLFVGSHNDGGYSVWAVTNGNTCSHQPVSSTIPYGEEYTHTRTLLVTNDASITMTADMSWLIVTCIHGLNKLDDNSHCQCNGIKVLFFITVYFPHSSDSLWKAK